MKQLTKDIIDAVSLETGIAPSYIEKDWYLVSVKHARQKGELFCYLPDLTIMLNFINPILYCVQTMQL